MTVPLFQFEPGDDASHARLHVFANERSALPISRYLTGKFCEHLGSNINHGMLAQILYNSTFAEYPFFSGRMSPDGRTLLRIEDEEIATAIRRRTTDFGWPDESAEQILRDYRDGLACWWLREGPREEVCVSPDTGPHGGRAQRVETRAPEQGVAQWVYLPLHRVRRFEITLVARAPKETELTIALRRADDSTIVAATTALGLAGGWTRFHGTLELPAEAPDAAPYRLTVTAPQSAHFVLDRVLLSPADHVGGCDPDVIRLLRESRLPILRWPGGNFVSGYRWEDGIGPRDARPTRPNPAWGGVEPNLFGTDEFIAFCREVDCEPMICVNAGDGTPEEAARWVEYCNGRPDTPMGALRAANGHPEPYHVRHWEVGNELWGDWQVHWTTPEGYVDRYGRFAAAMQVADPGIRLYACGAPVLWGDRWNRALFAGAARELSVTTDHPLIGGPVSCGADPIDVYRDFMGVPAVLERRWGALRLAMQDAGVEAPELAITELQLFAHIVPPAEPDVPVALTPANLLTPGTLGEALYDVLIYHAAVRLAPFVRLVTQSATVNHGGGLRKQRERVYPNPCHHAQTLFATFAGATPVSISLQAGTARMPVVLGDLKSAGEGGDYPLLDALAAIAPDGALLLSLVHRGADGPIRLEIGFDGYAAGPEARLQALTASLPWSANSRERPADVVPVETALPVSGDELTITVPPWSVLAVRVPVERKEGRGKGR